MKKGDLKKDDILVLEQLTKSLEEAYVRLDVFYNIKDAENFAKVKYFISQIQKKISGVLE